MYAYKIIQTDKTSPLLATFSIRLSAESSRPLRATRRDSLQGSTGAVDRRPTCLTTVWTQLT